MALLGKKTETKPSKPTKKKNNQTPLTQTNKQKTTPEPYVQIPLPAWPEGKNSIMMLATGLILSNE